MNVAIYRHFIAGEWVDAADIRERRRDEVVGLLARETGCTFGFDSAPETMPASEERLAGQREPPRSAPHFR